MKIPERLIKKVDDIITHLVGETVADALGGERRLRDKEGKIKPLSYEDNAVFMRFLARVANKFFSDESPEQWLIQRNKFILLLNQTAKKFVMKKVNPQTVWSRFLDSLFKQIDPRLQNQLIEVMETHLPGRFKGPGSDKKKIPIEPQLITQLKLLLALPFMRLVNQQSENDAMELIKQFVELGSDKERFLEYQLYLTSLEQLVAKSRSPLIVWPRFLRFMFKQASPGAKKKLKKRAMQGVKLLSRHMSVYNIEREAIQWLANPFIEAVTDMMRQSEEEAEQFLKLFCELPDDEARLNAYMAVMAQPERSADILKRLGLSGLEVGVDLVKRLRQIHEQAARQHQDSGQTSTSVIDGWLTKAKQFNQQS